MFTPSLVSLLAFASLALQTVALVSVANAGAKDTIPNNYIVLLKPFSNAATLKDHTVKISSFHSRRSLEKRAATKGVKTTFTFDSNGLVGYAIECDKGTLDQILKSSQVVSVQQEGIVKVSITQQSSTWGQARISHKTFNGVAPFSYPYQATWAGNGVTVYVVDTGIRISHVDFEGRASNGYNAVGGVWADQFGHGTHVAGTAVSKTYGVAKKAKVVSVKVLNQNGEGNDSLTLKGLEWICKNAMPGKSVVNMSIGGPKSEAVNKAIEGLIKKGILVVVAAGNDNVDAATGSPSSATGAITVGAIDRYNTRATFSNFGSVLDIFAPGVDIISLSHLSDTATYPLQGTSMASPHVAGLSAYFISSYASKSAAPADITARIINTSNKGQVIDPHGSPNRIAYNGWV